MTRVFISRDMASVALGADAVAKAFADAGCDVVRTGSHGLFPIEPLVEVERPDGRDAFGPVAPRDVASVLAGDHISNVWVPRMKARIDGLLKIGGVGFLRHRQSSASGRAP